jgi:hypothetical protein
LDLNLDLLCISQRNVGLMFKKTLIVVKNQMLVLSMMPDFVLGLKIIFFKFLRRYVSASSGPKKVILIIDKSGSMTISNRMNLAISAAITVIDGLSFTDYVGVVSVCLYFCNEKVSFFGNGLF